MESGQTRKNTKRATVRLTREQESDLRFYFEHGMDRLESPSNMAAQLERAEFFWTNARPCVHCGGDRETDTPGTGFITDSTEFQEYMRLCGLLETPVEVTEWVKKHNLAKKRRKKKREKGQLDAWLDVECPDEEYLDGEILCPKCEGKCWVPGPKSSAHGPLTARPSGSSIHGSGVPDTGGNDSIARTGKLDRQLATLRRQSPIQYAALAARYSPQGYERGISSLWHLTPAGKTMLRGNGLGLPERQFFENLSDRLTREQDTKRAAKLQSQFTAANEQAEKLEQDAIVAWQAILDVEAEAA